MEFSSDTKKRIFFGPSCIYKEDTFTLEHTTSFNIPGYLVLLINKNTSLDNQSSETLSKLGNILALTMRCIKAVIKTNYVYCLLFGEMIATPHFHLFPRTEAIKKEYQLKKNLSLEHPVSGPDLFAWIMKTKTGMYQDINSISSKIVNKFENLKNNYIKE